MRRKFISPEKRLAVFEIDKYTCQYYGIHGHECNEKKRDNVLFPQRMQGKNLTYRRNFVLQNENMYMDYLVEVAGLSNIIHVPKMNNNLLTPHI